jgi:hypothetical protein
VLFLSAALREFKSFTTGVGAPRGSLGLVVEIDVGLSLLLFGTAYGSLSVEEALIQNIMEAR